LRRKLIVQQVLVRQHELKMHGGFRKHQDLPRKLVVQQVMVHHHELKTRSVFRTD
jgi:hypothetical protein